VVICKRSSSQVLRVESAKALSTLSAEGVKCSCGAQLTDERLEEAIDLTDLGRKLLAGSWWMSILLVEQLHSLGIPYSDMLVEQKDGSEEIDCFANLSGWLCLFELKDKEFSLGHAYSFGAKIGLYGPNRGVIVTTAYVGGDVKEHFRKSQTADRQRARFGNTRQMTKMLYIEGIENLRRSLEGLIEEAAVVDAHGAFDRALPMAAIDSASLAEAMRNRFSRLPPEVVEEAENGSPDGAEVAAAADSEGAAEAPPVAESAPSP
jgi:hypothetical protein